MRVLNVATQDRLGGAAQTARLLHNTLNSATPIHSSLLTSLYLESPDSKRENTSRLLSLIQECKYLFSRSLLQLQYTQNPCWHSLSLPGFSLHQKINNLPIDIVNLHWVQREFLSIESIARINKPIVWTLHDSWAFCGSEHHPLDESDVRYIDGYTSNNRSKHDCLIDLDRWCWERKLREWRPRTFSFICPSTWMQRQLRKSYLFKNSASFCIPNPVNPLFLTDAPLDEAILLRHRLQVNTKTVITLGSAFTGSDPNKNITSALNILVALAEKYALKVIVYGATDLTTRNALSHLYPSISVLGRLSQHELRNLFAITDINLVPSSIESFGLVAAESQAVGVPVVAFNGSGIQDIVSNQETGLLVEHGSHTALYRALEILITSPAKRRSFANLAKARARTNYAPDSIAQKYAYAYKTIVESARVNM